MNSIDIKRSTIKVNNNNNKESSSLHLVGNPGQVVALHPKEEDHFKILYKQHFAEVMNFIHLQSGMAHPEAEDIAQDIFLILWRRREKLFKIPPSELKYYLFVMVKSRLINEAKKTVTRRRYLKQIEEERPTYAYTAHHELYDRRAERWLIAAIGALSPKRQTAYLLREQHGLKVYEIVSRMGISQSGACFLLQKAKRQIRSFLARQIM
jgi:RNA polymerase sigma factor (sigma-70 family)